MTRLQILSVLCAMVCLAVFLIEFSSNPYPQFSLIRLISISGSASGCMGFFYFKKPTKA